MVFAPPSDDEHETGCVLRHPGRNTPEENPGNAAQSFQSVAHAGAGGLAGILLTLTWDRMDLEKGRIFLPGHLTKTGQERLVPITPILRRELQRLRARDGVTRIKGLVFRKNGKKLNHTYREVQRLCKEKKIENFLFHDLRHCAVTNLADSGVDTETIMKIVGHSSVEMFLRYRTIKAETLDAAMTRLNTLITRHENAARQVPAIAAL